MVICPSCACASICNNQAVPTKTNTSVRVLRAKALDRQSWLVHGFSTRPGGSSTAYGRRDDLNLGFTKEDSRVAVERNRVRFLQALGAARWPMVMLKQVHSDAIHRVSSLGA